MDVDPLYPGPAATGGSVPGATDPAAVATAAAPPAAEPPLNAAASGPPSSSAAPAAEGGNSGANDATDDRAVLEEFSRFIRSYTVPSILSSKWKFLGEETPRRLESSAAEFVEALEHKYSTEALVKLGLGERHGDELRMPAWVDDDTTLFVTFDADGLFVEMRRDRQFLFPMRNTALEFACQRRAAHDTATPEILYVVAADEDVDILHQLGLHAVISEALESLGRDDIRKTFDGDYRGDNDWQYSLLLMDFKVADLKNQPTAAIGEVIKRLANAAEVYDIDPSRRFSVCRPSAEEFQTLELAVGFEDPAPIRQILAGWAAAAKLKRVNSWRTDFAATETSFSAARTALTTALQASNPVVRKSRVAVALPAYRAAGRTAITDRFFGAIDLNKNPFDRLSLLAAGDKAEAYMASDPLVRRAEAVMADQPPPSAEALREEAIKLRLPILAEFRQIRRDCISRR